MITGRLKVEKPADGQWRIEGGEVWWVQNSPPPPPKFQSFDKPEPNSQFRGKYIRNNLIRIRVSLICKLSGTPDQGATQIPVLSAFCPLPNLLNPPKKSPGYDTAADNGLFN
jgi:hypothetical protein